jgi:hypothetical protein
VIVEFNVGSIVDDIAGSILGDVVVVSDTVGSLTIIAMILLTEDSLMRLVLPSYPYIRLSIVL